jgi:uncharacterized protein involved in response to NO
MSSAPASSTGDRSVLRSLRRSGETFRDGRGRIAAMPPILQYGFRPFFFMAALDAGVAIPAWLWIYFMGYALPGPFSGFEWHAHEMLFGYLGAVMAGFILTAIPNWTGRLPLSGWPLAGLVALWLAGRAACALVADPVAAMVADLAFPAVLAFAVWREVVAGRNWKNVPVAAMITLFGLANGLHHAENLGLPDDIGLRVALGVAAMLIALSGGRIVPSFTRNWLVKGGSSKLPASFGRLDKAALALTALATVLWIGTPGSTAAGIALTTAGAFLAVRLFRWHGYLTVSEPILLILHVGYGWLAVALMLLGISSLSELVPENAALHALTAGAIGTMTLAVMTRASLGHTGRGIVADRTVIAIYCAVTLGAALRVAAPFADVWYAHVLACGGVLWSAAFLLFAVRYAPVLFGPKAIA